MTLTADNYFDNLSRQSFCKAVILAQGASTEIKNIILARYNALLAEKPEDGLPWDAAKGYELGWHREILIRLGLI